MVWSCGTGHALERHGGMVLERIRNDLDCSERMQGLEEMERKMKGQLAIYPTFTWTMAINQLERVRG